MFNMLCAEHDWLDPDNRIAIFPDSLALCETLMRSQFDLGKGAAIDTTGSTFSVFTPRGLKFGGVQASSFIVECDSRDDRISRANAFNELASIKQNMKNIDSIRPDSITVYYSPINAMTSMHQINLTTEDLIKLISTNDDDSFKEAVKGMAGELPNAIDIPYQKDLLRFLVSLLIYMTALGDKSISDYEEPLPNKLTDKGVQLKPVRLNSFATSDESSPAAHLRAMHFRNLQNEKYYQGDFSKKPKGSRWTLVRETSINPTMNIIKVPE